MIKLSKIISIEYQKKAFGHLIKKGPKSFLSTAIKRLAPFDIDYGKWFEFNKPTPDEVRIQKCTKFDYAPLISIIVPTFNTPIEYLSDMISSVKKQTYSNWELCIADGASTKIEVRDSIKHHSQSDKRIKYVFLDKNLGISGNTNRALEIATGDYVGLLDHDDTLCVDALFEIVSSLQHASYDCIYSDEDLVTHNLKAYVTHAFKPDFSPHLLMCHNYITHFFVTKRDIANHVGGFRSDYDGSQDYDFILRCIENSESIKHIPRVLYHWRCHKNSVAGDSESKMYAYAAGKKAVEQHFIRQNISASVDYTDKLGYYHPVYTLKPNPLLSIIIPNMDHIDDLKKCVESLFNVSKYKNFEVIVVENNSKDQNTFEYYDKIQNDYKNLRVVYYDGDFNFSKINNFAYKFVKGSYLLFLNNDTELISPDGLSEMLGLCTQTEVGIVGAKLLYGDDTVQHSGVVVGFGGFAGHVFTKFDCDDPGYGCRNLLNCDYSAVTGACLMISKDLFNDVGKFDQDFKVGLNDIDLCLRVREKNFYVVCNCFTLWKHYESKSRGYDDQDIEKTKRLKSEVKRFQKKWSKILRQGDPFYNKNFPIDYTAYELRVDNLKRKIPK